MVIGVETYVLVTPPILLSNAQQAVIQRCGTVDDGHTVTGVFMPCKTRSSDMNKAPDINNHLRSIDLF